MKELKHRILKLENAAGDLSPSKAERDEWLGKVQQYLDQFLDQLTNYRTFVAGNENPSLFHIDGQKKNIEEILQIYESEVVEKGIKPASGGHIGYIPGGGIYTSGLADYLSDVTNIYTGIHFASPGGVAMEHAILTWMKELFGYPESAVGNLSSGGSIANLIALTAARDRHRVKSDRVPHSVIYLSEQVHHCIQKSLRIIGLEDVIIRYIDLDEHSRLKPDLLRKTIITDRQNGLNPFLVIASAGTTDTGAIDPLEQIGTICKEEGLWFHVDAAYGGFFILVDSVRTFFSGIEMSDSLVVDPHKGLFLPYGLGAVLVKDREAVLHSHHYTASYLQDAQDPERPLNPADVSPELTKPFRSLRLWLPLMLHGIEPFRACLEEKLLLTRYFREELLKRGFRLGPDPDLTVSYFWYPRESSEDVFNARLMESIHRDGEIFLSSTRIKGRFVIRMAILSFRTHMETIDRCLNMIDRCLAFMLREEQV